ncbi:MAG TPA: disulfide bond formation protein B [Devosiaceae bacterium]|jgi:disulfide bond formation protein DsbB|nr:disulfide bond formation protein B [Devosiaceae bacterium]
MTESNYVLAAWVVALTATLGALFIGEVMGQVPCVLCWYQRIAMFPIVAVLGLGLWLSDPGAWRYGMALALIGVAVAAWHVLVYYGLVPQAIVPCTADGPSCSGEAMTLLGTVPLPLLSLGAFTLIAVLLLASRRRITA